LYLLFILPAILPNPNQSRELEKPRIHGMTAQGRDTSKGQWVTQFTVSTRWHENSEWLPCCDASGKVSSVACRMLYDPGLLFETLCCTREIIERVGE
jgi:hypothetical protein